MPDDDAKESKTESTEDAPKAKAIVTSDKAKSAAADKPAASAASTAGTKAKAKAKAAAPVDDAEDEEDDEEWDDEDEDEEEDLPPPPKKSAKSKTAPAKVGRPVPGRVAARAVAPPLHAVVRQGPMQFLPYALGGMALVAVHVFQDWSYQPVVVLGIALCVWAFIGVGSANEIKA